MTEPQPLGMSAAERDLDTSYMGRQNGPPLAAVVAASFGTFVLGLLTTLNEASAAVHDFLELYAPVGPLSGKTTFAVAAWIAAWIVLGIAWRGRQVDFRRVVIFSAVLIGLGIVGTYPSFFERFASE